MAYSECVCAIPPIAEMRDTRRHVWEDRTTGASFLDDSSVQIRHNEVRRLHLVVRDTTGLDDDQAFLASKSAGVSKGRKHQSSSDQVQIGLEDLFS